MKFDNDLTLTKLKFIQSKHSITMKQQIELVVLE